MEYRLTDTLAVLESTPDVLVRMLHNLPDELLHANEGPDTWNAFDIVGHLIHGEKTDWIPRMQIILGEGDKHFAPFDREAMFEASKGKSLADLLEEFRVLRAQNIETLKRIGLSDIDLDRSGIHPAFGEVTLRQLLATWTVHDWNHIYQLTRVLARQYSKAVGPWIEYLGVLERDRAS